MNPVQMLAYNENARPQAQCSHRDAKTTSPTRCFSGQRSFSGHVSGSIENNLGQSHPAGQSLSSQENGCTMGLCPSPLKFVITCASGVMLELGKGTRVNPKWGAT